MYPDRRGITLSITILVLLFGCKTTGLDPLQDFVNSYDYTLYVPPRSNHGPGWTFQLVKTFDGKTVPQTLCENLYPDVAVSNGSVSIPNIDTKSDVDADFAVELLEGIIESVGEAKANLKAKNLNNLNISWKKVQNHELIQERLFDANGKPIAISPTCGSKLKEIKSSGALDGVYVVYDAIFVEDMTYEAVTQSGTGGSVSISLKKLLTVKPSANVTDVSSSKLTIQEPRYVGFRAIALTDFTPTGLLGGEIVKVSGKKIATRQISTLLEK